MSAYEQEFFKAVVDRLNADTTLTGLLNDSIAWEAGTIGSLLPAITLNQTGTSSVNFLDGMNDEVTFDVHIWAESAGVGTDGGDPASTCATIMNRIRGDWMDQSNKVPTYGLAMHPLVLTGSSCSNSVITNTTGWMADHQGTDLHWYMSFKLFIQKAKP